MDKKMMDALLDAAETLYFVEKDGEQRVIRIYADYRDTNEWLLPKALEAAAEALENRHKSEEDPEKDFLYRMTEEIYQSYEQYIWEMQDDILDLAAKNLGLEDEDELRDILYDSPLSIEPDYDHFLNQPMKVNLILATDEEQNVDCNLVSEQGDALMEEDENDILSVPSGLSLLLDSQGCTMADLRNAMDRYQKHGYPENAKDQPQFLPSVCQEIENHTYSMGCITVLCEMNLYELAKLLRKDAQITFPTDAMVGIYNPWNGSGSVLDIALKKPFTVSSENLFRIQIEDAGRYHWEYTVNQTYGLLGFCWKPAERIETK